MCKMGGHLLDRPFLSIKQKIDGNSRYNLEDFKSQRKAAQKRGLG